MLVTQRCPIERESILTIEGGDFVERSAHGAFAQVAGQPRQVDGRGVLAQRDRADELARGGDWVVHTGLQIGS